MQTYKADAVTKRLLYLVVLVVTEPTTGFVVPPSGVISRTGLSCDTRDASLRLVQQIGTCPLPPRRWFNACYSAANNEDTSSSSSSSDAYEAAPVEEGRGGGGSIAGEGDLPACFTSEATVAWVQQILASWDTEYGKRDRLIGDREGVDEVEQARSLAVAPFAVISHDFLRDADDPTFIYGNLVGLRTFGYTWEEFTVMPSRKSCEADGRQDRAAFLDGVLREDESVSAQDYSSVRVTKSGEPFVLHETVLWNVRDKQGRVVGQAAKIARTSPYR